MTPLRLFILAAAASLVLWSGCQCGGGGLCDLAKCGPGTSCDPRDGMCKAPAVDGGGGAGGTGGAGGQSGACNPACTGSTPVCDLASGTCKTCTATEGCVAPAPLCDPAANGGLGYCYTCTSTQGCSAPTPFCDTSVQRGACIECRNLADCPNNGTYCDTTTHTCVGGAGGGGGSGGAGGSGGSAGGSGGSGGYGGGSGGGGGSVVVFDDAGMTSHCAGFDGGVKLGNCTTECNRGFVCVAGECVLRGSQGPVQVTLRFNQPEDLDLHVVEPLPDGGNCEIWYQNTNAPAYDGGLPWPFVDSGFPFPIPTPQSCGAKGWLDLDSNPACNIDNVDIENVIYPPTQLPTKGNYTVRMDYYDDCGSSSPINYEIEVRANGASRYYCGSVRPPYADSGGKGSGVTVTTFTIQ